jgi:hypothetical protein
MVNSKEYMKSYREKNKERITLLRRIYEKEYRQKPQVKAKRKDYMENYRQRETSKKSKRIQNKKYAKNHRKKLNKYLLNVYYNTPKFISYARRIALRMVPLKDKCEWCGSTQDLQRHHTNYLKPLEVMTLCAICHAKTRKKYGGRMEFPLLN